MGHSAIGTTVSNSVPVSMTDGPAAALVGYGVAAVVVLSIPPHSPSDEEPGQSASVIRDASAQFVHYPRARGGIRTLVRPP